MESSLSRLVCRPWPNNIGSSGWCRGGAAHILLGEIKHSFAFLSQKKEDEFYTTSSRTESSHFLPDEALGVLQGYEYKCTLEERIEKVKAGVIHLGEGHWPLRRSAVHLSCYAELERLCVVVNTAALL